MDYINQALNKAVQDFMAHISEDMITDEFSEQLKKDNLHITGKEYPGYYLKFQWNAPYTPEDFIEFTFNSEERSWEKNIDSSMIVCWPDEDTYVSYTKYKKVMIFSPRDLLIVSRRIPLEKGQLFVSTSVEHEDFNDTNFVRANLDMGGYYMEKLPQPDELGNLTRVLSVSKGHPGGNISTTMVKKFMVSNYINMIKGQNEVILAFNKKKSGS